ncbi:hypothetical protein ANO14919_141810 [Xylariales sp. No.14919]|nr:hypothetical protein ANO14919_141810 [Xylariales sp. No.14919]
MQSSSEAVNTSSRVKAIIATKLSDYVLLRITFSTTGASILIVIEVLLKTQFVYGDRVLPVFRPWALANFKPLLECWLAHRADVLCGGDHAPGEALHRLWILMERIDKEQREALAWFEAVPLLRRISRWRGRATVDLDLPRTGSKHLAAISMPPNFKGLECENARDRLYAVISIINWGDLDVELIQPDYDIDLLSLMLSLWPFIDEADLFASGFIILLNNLLHLTPLTSPKMLQAIHYRHHINTVKSAARMEAESISPISRLRDNTRGFQVFLDNREWKVSIPPHNHGNSEDCFINSNVELEMDCERTQPLASLPLCAQSGEWIVGSDTVGRIILREREMVDTAL